MPTPPDTPETLPAPTGFGAAARLSGRPEQFSRVGQSAFLDALAQGGNVRAACAAAGIARATAYRMRRACPHFTRLWDAALLVARTQVEAVLADRALNGGEETIFYHGEAVATRTRYDARLLLAHLGRLDRLTRDYAAQSAASEFDLELEELLAEREIAFEPHGAQGSVRARLLDDRRDDGVGEWEPGEGEPGDGEPEDGELGEGVW